MASSDQNIGSRFDKSDSDDQRRFFNNYFKTEINYNASEVDAVIGYFLKRDFDKIAANSYMKANENKKSITILEKALTELNPKTGKTEYLLGIIYLDMKQKNLGCEYLEKAKEKNFNFPDQILSQFCYKE